MNEKINIEQVLAMAEGFDASPHALYVAANAVKSALKDRIIELDVSGSVARFVPYFGVPEGELDAAKRLYEEIHRDQLKELDELNNGILLLHPEWYRKQTCLPHLWRPRTVPYIDSVSELEDAVQGYKLCNEVIKALEDSKSLDDACTEERMMLKYEFREEHQRMCAQHQMSLSLPSFEEWLEGSGLKLVERDCVKRNIRMPNRKPCENRKVGEAALRQCVLAVNFWKSLR